jgi:hypothetical protein
LRYLVNDILIDTIVTQVSLLFEGKFKHLAGGPHAVENLLIGETRLPHGHHLIHGHKAVAVQVSGRGAERLLRRGGLGLGSADRVLRRGSVMTGNAVAVGTDQVPAPCA